MNGNLLDTNVIIRLFRKDETVRKILKSLNDLSVPSIVLGELMYGASKSARIQENKEKALNFCFRYKILEVTPDVAIEYGNIKSSLERVGKIIPENDMWIAATAIANDLTLVSQDKHMMNVPGLKLLTI